MQPILDLASLILKESFALFVDLWQLLAVLVVLHLLYYLWAMGRNRRAGIESESPEVDSLAATKTIKPEHKAKVKDQKKEVKKESAKPRPKNKPGELELVEVDFRPVIVYRKPAEKHVSPPEPPPAPEEIENQQEEFFEEAPVLFTGRQNPEISAPKEPNQEAIKSEILSRPIESPTWAQAMEPPKGSVPAPAPEPLKYAEPLPLMESDLANDLLRDFREWGCNLEEVVYQGRFTADLVLSRPGLRIFVHIKEWKKKTGENVVMEVSGYRVSHRCDLAIIISVAGFDRSAEKAAGSKGILLWNKRELAKQRKNPTVLEDAAAAKN